MKTKHPLEHNLRTMSDHLRRCKLAYKSLANFSAISGAVGKETFIRCIAELTEGAHALSESAHVFALQTEKLLTSFPEPRSAANGGEEGVSGEA
jgi:hypothetical protein